MKFLLILLLYNFPFLVHSTLLLPSCNATCPSHKTTLIPVFSNTTSPVDIDLLKIYLISQVDTCYRGEFSVDLYLIGSGDWLRCCDARSCSRAILNLEDEEFLSTNFTGTSDTSDATGVAETVEQLEAHNSEKIYVLSNFILPKLWTTKQKINIALISDRLRNESLESSDKINVVMVSSFDELAKINRPYCSRNDLSLRTDCNYTAPADPVDLYVVELRIFLGFSSKGHFSQIVDGLAKFLTEEYFDEQIGKIIILGPRAKILARCWWYNAHKCILDLHSKGESFIHVDAEMVSRNDIQFAPDVMGFMRREAIQQKKMAPTFVLVISDFISLSFLDNKYYFQAALAAQPVALVLGVMLNWNGLDKQTVKKYYGSLLNSDDLYPMEVFADLNGLADRILNISFANPPINDSVTTTLSPVSTDHSIPDPATAHESDVVIVLALAYWTDEMELEILKNYLRSKAANCASEQSKYAIQTSDEDRNTVFCPDSPCFDDQITLLDRENAVSDVDNTYELVEYALNTLKPNRKPSDRMPAIVLITNYISKVFMKYYDDTKSDFRRCLSYVDFQMMLVNSSSTDYHDYSSLPNKVIHVYPTFEALKNAKEVFCLNQEKSKPDPDPATKSMGVGTLGIISLAIVSLVLFIALSAIIYTIHRNHQRNKLLSQHSDKVPIISREFDELGKEILNISGLARTRQDPWEMSRQQIIQGAELGRGSGGVVYRGSILGRAPCEYIYRRNFYAYQYDNCPVAIKEQLIGSDEKGRQQLLDEIEVMKAIRPHENIANMLGCVTSVNPVCLVLEYAEGGSLKEYLKGKLVLPAGTQLSGEKVVPQRDILSFLWQISDGLAFVHQCGVIHRDVAARNVLLKRGRDVLIADFGLAVWKESRTSYSKIKRLPIKWTSPEALSKAHFSESSDVWSFGICAWEILMSGEDPFQHVATAEILSYLASGRRPERPPTCSDLLWKLVYSCWQDDPEKRLTFLEIKSRLAPLLEEICSGYGYVVPQPESN